MKKNKIIAVSVMCIVALSVVCMGFMSTRQSGWNNLKNEMLKGLENNATSISGCTYIRKVIVYTYNASWKRYDKVGTSDLYKDSYGWLRIGNGLMVHENRDYHIPYKFWAVDSWGIYYYFD